MLTEHEANRQRVLAMIESAQRAGRTEPEIIRLAERYFNAEQHRKERKRPRKAA